MFMRIDLRPYFPPVFADQRTGLMRPVFRSHLSQSDSLNQINLQDALEQDSQSFTCTTAECIGEIMFSSILTALSGYAERKWQTIRQTRQTVRLTFELSRNQWPLMGAFLLVAIINALTESFSIMLIVPLLESFSSNSVFANVPVLSKIAAWLSPLEPIERLRWVALILLVIILVKSIVQYLNDTIVYILPIKLERELKMRAFSAIMESRISFAESISSGDTGNYTAAFPARCGLAMRFLIQLISSSLTIVLMLALLVAITPSALFALIAFAALGSFVFKSLTGHLAHKLDREMTDSQREFTQSYFEAINNKRTIRLFNATAGFLRRINSSIERLWKVQIKTIALQNSTYPFFSAFAGTVVCATVLAVSVYRPEQAQALLGILLVFLVASARLLGPFSVAHIARLHYSIHAEAIVEMKKFLDKAAVNRDEDGAIDLAGSSFSLAFREVSFTYPNSTAGVRNINFEVTPGEFIAIVGPSGSGKSTIFHLITRLYRPDRGKVVINGKDLNELRVRSWWDNITIVSQDVPVFNATIRDNIHFGRDGEIDDLRVKEALRLSAAEDFVNRMPNQIYSGIGEFGSRLSGGERQRLALTRAFYHTPPIILLDEVTSQVDAETESTIADSIEMLHARGHTIIAIAHRPSTIRGADRILVLRDGEIIDSGTHTSLMGRNPFYREMATQREKRAG